METDDRTRSPHRDVDDMTHPILCPARPEDSDELQKQIQKDKTARKIVGLTLFDEMLENVSHRSTALEMWK